MTRKAIIEREKKRKKLCDKNLQKRLELKERLRKLQIDSAANYVEIQEAYDQLRRLPRNSSPTRRVNRCRLTGRPRGVYRKVGLCRNMLRLLAMRGDIPGIVKASW